MRKIKFYQRIIAGILVCTFTSVTIISSAPLNRDTLRKSAVRGIIGPNRKGLSGEKPDIKELLSKRTPQRTVFRTNAEPQKKPFKKFTSLIIAVMFFMIKISLLGCTPSNMRIYPKTQIAGEKVYAGAEVNVPLGKVKETKKKDSSEKSSSLTIWERLGLLGGLALSSYFLDTKDKDLRAIEMIDIFSSGTFGALGAWYNDRDVIDSALWGGLGGTIMFGGKRFMADTISRDDYVSFFGKPIHSLGVSMRDNLIYGESPFSRYEFNIGPLILTYKAESKRFPVKPSVLPLATFFTLAHLSNKTFDLESTLKTGDLSFRGDADDMGGSRAFSFAGIVLYSSDVSPSDINWLRAHETTHSRQYAETGILGNVMLDTLSDRPSSRDSFIRFDRLLGSITALVGSIALDSVRDVSSSDDKSSVEFESNAWERYVKEKQKRHPFSSQSAFRASLLTGFVSLLSLAYGAYFYVMRPDLTVMALAALSIGFYLSFSAGKYYTRGIAAYDALKKWNRTLARGKRLSDKELRETPIAEATLEEIKFHHAFKHIKENKIKEDIRRHEYIEQKALNFLNRHPMLKPLINTQLPHYIAMLAMLPVMDMFIHGKEETAPPISEKSRVRKKHPLQISPPSKSKILEHSL